MSINTAVTIRHIVVIVNKIIAVDYSATVLAGGVIVIVTASAERHTVRARIVVVPYPVTKMLTGHGFLKVAGVVKQISIKSVTVISSVSSPQQVQTKRRSSISLFFIFDLLDILLQAAWWNASHNQLQKFWQLLFRLL